jgi:hypothetical protein
MANRKTWISIVIAAFIIVVVAALGLFAGAFIYVRRHAHSEVTQASTAEAEFARVRARFEGQTPLIELKVGEPPILHRTPAAPAYEIQSLHVIGYDASSGKLSHVDLPGWMLRMMSAGGRFRLANLGFFDDEDNRVTLEDLERHGPGLIVDIRRSGRVQAVVWIE